MATQNLLLLTLALPICSGLLMLIGRRHILLAETLTLLTPVLLFGCVIALLPQMHDCDGSKLLLGQFGQGLQLAFAPEATGWLFALLATTMWIPTSWYAVGYARSTKLKNTVGFHAMFALAMACTIGIALSDNLLTLFVFYELLTLSTFGLVGHHGSKEAKAGAKRYLVYLLGTSLALLLPAIMIIYAVYGSLDFVPGGLLAANQGGIADSYHQWLPTVLYLLVVFGTGKAALMPLHRWLPGAMVAPAPVSALLHAVAVVKAGVFTLLKTTMFTFGHELMAGGIASELIVLLASFTIVAASVVALRSDDIKRRLAYSTVGQLAYISLGVAAMSPAGAIAAGLHMVAHATAKITLFLCAGLIIIATGRTKISQCNGLAKRLPVTFATFAIAALALAGIPPSLNLWSKWHLLGTFAEPYSALPLLAIAISSILSLWYLLELPLRGFFAKAPAANLTSIGKSGGHVPLICNSAIIFTTIATVVLFFLAGPLYQWLLHPILGTAYCEITSS